MILTIGKFEAIHLGHRALLQEVSSRAKILSTESAAIIFKPHPFKFLHDTNYKPIFSEHEREKLIRETGTKKIITLDFDSQLASMKAEDFCEKLFREFNVREIFVGESYRFGKNREGTIETLCDVAITHNAKLHVMKNITGISTSLIRNLLAEKKFSEAEKLLGFSFFIEGEVEKGRQLGRVLGFPTLNIYPPDDKFLPAFGVYKTRAIIDGNSSIGVTNIGVRPTVDDGEKISVETHIPTLIAKPDELYGKKIKIEFLNFIRNEEKFANVEDLKFQIKNDVASIKN
ncbi:MAG: riboflavin biosynthesis protein RibF [Defluviitaleaceae bacterium]|nr:riboflavin biosynthesis protein RibF [Defluviitaleaceae bacterium]